MADDVGNNSLLKRFRLTEGCCRKRFKNVKIEVGDTEEQFVDRLKKYLTKWREMAGFEAAYEGLQNMILRDQFLPHCIECYEKAVYLSVRTPVCLSVKCVDCDKTEERSV